MERSMEQFTVILPCILLLSIQSCLASAGSSLCDEEFYTSPVNVRYDLKPLCEQPIHTVLAQPEGADLTVGLREKNVECGDEGPTAGCITVPGLNPTSVGSKIAIQPTSSNIPSHGLQITLSQGSKCEAKPNKNRTTTIRLVCPHQTSHITLDDSNKELSARERPEPFLCEYIVEIITSAACPIKTRPERVVITAVSGCRDSIPAHYTQSCSGLGGSRLTLHGAGFSHLELGTTEITIGQSGSCEHIKVVSDWMLECVVRVNSPVDAELYHSHKLTASFEESYNVDSCEVVIIRVNKGVSISFTPVPNFEKLFSNLHQYGVAGMKSQAKQVYERVFLTRTLPPHILTELGLSHVTGLILHGPPGTGKSLLARVIASVIDAKHVHMISSPELLNKYVGESEHNLRALFYQAEKDAEELGSNSPFHVIILDEIDAICKPRGRDKNNIGSLVYDSLVNQLLTKLDGLSVNNNFLVIGLTNRFELLDEALLRPGRFEVHIEMTLPDVNEREEILQLHLSKALESKRLHSDVKISMLAEMTSGFTPAQLAGLVRQAQASALTTAQSTNSLSNTQITWSDLMSAADGLVTQSIPGYNVTVEKCAAYAGIDQVVNSTKPRTALIQVEMYKLIVPCLIHLLENHGYFVKVYRPEDILREPFLLQRLHTLPSTVRNEKVAVIMMDLCYVLHTCYSSTPVAYAERDNFLMSMRALTANRTDGKKTVLVGICPSYCNIDALRQHFSSVFSMVTLDVGMSPSLGTQNKTVNASLKSKKLTTK